MALKSSGGLWPLAFLVPGLGALLAALFESWLPSALGQWCTGHWWQLLLPGACLYLMAELAIALSARARTRR
jgi:hypothetical protein